MHEFNVHNTPLSLAAAYGHIDVVRVLLERGADPCYRAYSGTAGGEITAGDVAREKGFKELADLLKAAETQKCK